MNQKTRQEILSYLRKNSININKENELVFAKALNINNDYTQKINLFNYFLENTLYISENKCLMQKIKLDFLKKYKNKTCPIFTDDELETIYIKYKFFEDLYIYLTSNEE